MSYMYFPGCSLKGTGRAYEESMLAVFEALKIPMKEIDDWNCCGATAYMSVSELKAFALSARNFALAEQQNGDNGSAEMVVPCAACYLGLNKARRYLNEYKTLNDTVKRALAAGGLEYHGHTKIRHPLDVLVNDIGTERIAEQVNRPLAGLKVACYYGCQLVRPFADFDDQHDPTSMNRIVKALGGETIDWPLKTRCCGGSLTGTIQDVGLRLSYILLNEAKKRGSDVIITACPLCQFNLECYQPQIAKRFGGGGEIPVVYFTQLMGIAFGLEQRKLGMNRLFVRLQPSNELREVAGGQHVHS
ncbi:MAG: disulfide reductase [candidate division Zixibacteria bacterium HGW-Zixibacteria-1]|nr:MAG: disulfide reductase [candidate division Zixibacteria bacterium HGW-Zixibacteria-1]